ncbi:MAG TPA: choice-of-anchor tandem repeat GloVer-containing protein [Rhizomicrobium sp.]|jgi:uncharacterized repeat protein (TIGR03803 family)|nr:choice-of-anchor tandem repeat GloVer-containing protein [Rhizomicrobium sp.]
MKSIVIALIAGVSVSASVQPVLAADARHAKETVVYSFMGGSDGFGPSANLIDVKGTLYSTTQFGGSGSGGTVFALDPSTGAETVLYSFCSQQNCTDGELPSAGLIEVAGALYGTTGLGGTDPYAGVAFALDPNTGAETVLHSFGSGSDGVGPIGFIEVKGTLYGTTGGGGAYGYGTVFALDPKTGAEQVLHSFGSGEDGRNPQGNLINVKGTLYGLTANGGAGGNVGGTAFAFDLKTGAETVVYSFCRQPKCTDGWYPTAGMIEVKGNLYGVTQFGGASEFDDGTIFSLDTTTGAEKVVYSFCGQQNCTDGSFPAASLIDVKDALYGTTVSGGGIKCKGDGCGIAFSVDPKTGAEQVLHHFCSAKSCTDGNTPYASLLDIKGTLYGTTAQGGAYNEGTVFALKP